MALELELWQVGKSDSLAGRILHWMSGDVGMKPVPVVGRIQGSAVWFEIVMPAPSAAVRIEGTLAGDTLEITKATTGGDDNGLTGGRFVRFGSVKS